MAASRVQVQKEESKTIEVKTDIPVAQRRSVERKPEEEFNFVEMQREGESQRARKLRSKDTQAYLSVAQVEDKSAPPHFAKCTGDKDTPSTQTFTSWRGGLTILDTETSLSLSPDTTKEFNMEESRASLPPSVTTSMEESTEPRVSLDLLSETSNEPMDPTFDSKPSESQEFLTSQEKDKETSPEISEWKIRKSRSRSPSPIGIPRTRQTASPLDHYHLPSL